MAPFLNGSHHSGAVPVLINVAHRFVIMTDFPHREIDSPHARTSSSAVWAVSLAFWTTLVVAALMYASVALAPRLYAWMQVRHDYLTNAHGLRALEAEVDYLERVRDALRTDPEFVRRMAASSLAEDPGDAEVIPVSGALIFGSNDQLQERMPEVKEPVGAAIIQQFAANRHLRTMMLSSATFLAVFSFTVLNGSGGWFVATVSRLAVATVRFPLARYRRIELPEADEPLDGLSED